MINLGFCEPFNFFTYLNSTRRIKAFSRVWGFIKTEGIEGGELFIGIQFLLTTNWPPDLFLRATIFFLSPEEFFINRAWETKFFIHIFFWKKLTLLVFDELFFRDKFIIHFFNCRMFVRCDMNKQKKFCKQIFFSETV